jgi:hypothetical protein
MQLGRRDLVPDDVTTRRGRGAARRLDKGTSVQGSAGHDFFPAPLSRSQVSLAGYFPLDAFRDLCISPPVFAGQRRRPFQWYCGNPNHFYTSLSFTLSLATAQFRYCDVRHSRTRMCA